MYSTCTVAYLKLREQYTKYIQCCVQITFGALPVGEHLSHFLYLLIVGFILVFSLLQWFTSGSVQVKQCEVPTLVHVFPHTEDNTGV